VTTYVALLRAINLGKTRKVPMAQLREFAAELGFANVRTFLQSGNLVFESDSEAREIVDGLEAALLERLGFAVPVILRTGAEMQAVARAHPFGSDEDDPVKLHVVFYAEAPPREAVEDVLARDVAPDCVAVQGREAFVHYARGLQGSRVKLDALGRGTDRNWRTVQALAAMVGHA
jgi:uncharacterized protein (DUF1697 family)